MVSAKTLFAAQLCCVYACFEAPTTYGFVPRQTHRVGYQGVSRSTSRTRVNGTIEFKGESTTSIEVPLPAGGDSTKSLSQWMLSDESAPFFLGTKEYRERSDGCYDAFQPSVDWFGLELVPVFVIQLERSDKQVAALIQAARNDIRSGQNSPTGRLVSKVMGGSTFQGGNTVAWKEKAEGDGWTVQADLSLTLSIKLPPFLPLPPGFNSIGSRIVKSTCNSRLKKFVVSLQEAYLEWAEKQ